MANGLLQRNLRTRQRLAWWLLLIGLPGLAHAQAYKCRQADGAMSFQDRPCSAGEASSVLSMPPPRSDPAPARPVAPARYTASPKMLGSPQTAEQETQRRRAEAELAAQIQQVNAQNRMLRCNFARRQLGVLKAQRPAYSHDNNGDRHYVEDDQRAAETASWEKRVAAECQ